LGDVPFAGIDAELVVDIPVDEDVLAGVLLVVYGTVDVPVELLLVVDDAEGVLVVADDAEDVLVVEDDAEEVLVVVFKLEEKVLAEAVPPTPSVLVT